MTAGDDALVMSRWRLGPTRPETMSIQLQFYLQFSSLHTLCTKHPAGAPARQRRGQRHGHVHGSATRSSGGDRSMRSISRQPGQDAAWERGACVERGDRWQPVQHATADSGAAAEWVTRQQPPQQRAAGGWGAARRGGVDAGPLVGSRPRPQRTPHAAVSLGTRPHASAQMPAVASGMATGEAEVGSSELTQTNL